MFSQLNALTKQALTLAESTLEQTNRFASEALSTDEEDPVAALRKQLADAEELNVATAQEYKKLLASKEEELTAVRNESDAAKLVHKLQAEKDDAVSQLNKLKVKAKTRIQELQAALEAAKGTAAAAAAADTPLQTPTASSFSPSNNSSTVVKQLEDELEQTQQTLMEQKKELASTSALLEERTKQLEQAAAKVEEREQQLDEQKEMLAAIGSEASKAKKDRTEYLKQIGDLQAKLSKASQVEELQLESDRKDQMAKIDAMQKSESELKAQLDALQAQLTESKEAYTTLTEVSELQKASMMEQIVALQGNSSSISGNDNLNKLTPYRPEASPMATPPTASRVRRLDMSLAAADEDAYINISVARLEELEGEVQALKARNEQLESQQSQGWGDVSALAATIDDMPGNKEDDVSEEMSTLRTQLIQLSREKSELQARLDSTVEEQTNMRQQIASQQEKSTNDSKRLREQIEDLRKSMWTLETERDQLEEDKQQLQEEIDEWKANGPGTPTNAISPSIAPSFESEYKAASAQVDQLTLEVDSLRGKVEMADAARSSDLASLQNQLDETVAKLQQTTTSSASVHADLDRAQKELAEHAQQNAALQASLNLSQKELAERVKHNAAIQADLDRSQKELKAQAAAAETVVAERAAQTQSIAQLESSLAAANAEASELKQSKAAASAQLTHLQESLATMAAEKSALESQLHAKSEFTSTTGAEQSEQLAALAAKLHDAESKLAQHAQASDEKDSLVASLKDALAGNKSRLSQVMDVVKAQEDELQQLNKRLEDSAKSLENHTETEQRLLRVQAECKDALESATAMKTALGDKQSKLSEMTNKVLQLEAVADGLRQQLGERDKNLAKSSEQLQQAQTDGAEKQSKIDSITTAHASEVTALKSDIASLQENLQTFKLGDLHTTQLQQRVEELSNELRRTQASLNEKDQLTQSQRLKLDELQDDHSQLTAQYAQQINELQAKLSYENNGTQDLLQQLHQAQGELQQLQKASKELSEALQLERTSKIIQVPVQQQQQDSTQNDELVLRAEAAESQFNEASKQIAELKDQLGQAQQKLGVVMASPAKDLSKVQRDLERVRAELQQSRDESLARISALNSENEQLREKLVTNQNVLNDLTSQQRSLGGASGSAAASLSDGFAPFTYPADPSLDDRLLEEGSTVGTSSGGFTSHSAQVTFRSALRNFLNYCDVSSMRTAQLIRRYGQVRVFGFIYVVALHVLFLLMLLRAIF